jgi:hypothetical protein
MRLRERQISFGGERVCKIASSLSSKAYEPAAGGRGRAVEGGGNSGRRHRPKPLDAPLVARKELKAPLDASSAARRRRRVATISPSRPRGLRRHPRPHNSAARRRSRGGRKSTTDEVRAVGILPYNGEGASRPLIRFWRLMTT